MYTVAPVKGGRQLVDWTVDIAVSTAPPAVTLYWAEEKMSKIKLTHYNARGRAETIRLVLAYAGKQYEDKRIAPGRNLLSAETNTI